MNKKLQVFFAILVSTVFLRTGYAQDSQVPRMAAGATSLDFTIDKNFQLKSFSGSTLSGTCHINERTAFRVGLSINSNYQVNDYYTYQYTNPLENSDNSHYSSTSVTINAVIMYYSKASGSIFFYYGAGPAFTYKRGRGDGSSIIEGSKSSEYTTTEDGYMVAVTGILGVEYFIDQRFSVHAEYGVYAGYSSNKFKEKSYSIPDYNSADYTWKSTGFSLSNKDIALGLSIYF